jgi:hypothetical protein
MAAAQREHAAGRVDVLQRRLEELRLGHEADLAADERGEKEVVHERAVVRREDDRAALRDLLAGDRARAKERQRPEAGEHAHDLVGEVRLLRARALVERDEVLGRTLVASS